MLQVWGRNNSINVQKVRWACLELGLAHEMRDPEAELGGLKTPEYRRLNPTGRIPAIEDDAVTLWEAHAIVRYLAARHDPGGLWPDAPAERAEAERWMDWDLGTLWTHARPVFIALVRTRPEDRDEAALERNRGLANEDLLILDKHLQGREFIAHERLTIADIPVGCAVYRWLNMPVERPPLPNVERWYANLSRRTAYRDAVMLPIT